MTGATHTPLPKRFEHVGLNILKMKGISKTKMNTEEGIVVEDKRN